MDKKKKIIIGVIAIVVIIAIVSVVFIFMNGGKGSDTEIANEEKTVTIIVTTKDKNSTEYKVTTTGKYLKDAMDAAEGLEYEVNDLNEIMTINGNTYNVSVDGTYWASTVNGAPCSNTYDKQEIKDGDEFVIHFMMD